MKIIIKETIPYNNIKKYLPKGYADLLPANGLAEQIVNIILFPCDRKKVITSRYIQKAQQRIKDKSVFTLYFGGCFTMEARAMISDSKGILLMLKDYPWSDENWIRIHSEL